MSSPQPAAQAWRNELSDIVRGASGGFLFGIPLIYTMEVWWIGSYTEPWMLLMVILLTYGIVFLLNRTDGFRQMSPDPPLRAAMDSVEALAIGVVCTFCVLVLLREITAATPWNEALGKIVFESVPFSIGVALARSILGEGSGRTQSSNSSSDPLQEDSTDETPRDTDSNRSSHRRSNTVFNDIGATLVGSVFIAFSIAPTDEVPMIAAATSPPWLLAIMGASLVVSYGIVFVAGFVSQGRRIEQSGLFQIPIVETIVSYLFAIISAALMLFFFNRLGFDDSWSLWLKQVIVLGLPAAVGGAAGRLAI